ncbi:MAG TPA: LacI family DNA-binding transcriptional regulator [Pseudolysinimonas sp.]|nr:LacI family DNA-binding transcriptional regulator [Pseudolysinimonas sp.]
MPKRVTIAEVAELAGVHKGTVSRALGGSTEGQVNAATVRRVQEAAEQLGYVPNIVARGLRTSLSMSIGVIIPDLTNPIFPPMVRGIENYLAPRGYTALVANSDGREQLERGAFESLLARRVDGFILGTGHTDDPLLAGAVERDVRVVLINRGTASDIPYPLVTGDDAAGITAAVDHLAGLGHRRVLHLAGPRDFTTSIVRADAFAAAADRRRLRHATNWLPALSIGAGRDAMDEVLSDRRAAWTAVVAANDLVALGVMRSLREHGLGCPADMSVIGFNDMPFAADFSPPLTTVNVPHLQMGAECARLLLEGIAAGAQDAITTTLPVSLIVRESTAPPRN